MPAYFDKEKKTWYVKFWYKDYTGKRRQTTKRGFKLKKDALRYERDFIEARQGSTEIKFKTLAVRYLVHLKQKVRPNTYITAKRYIELHILPFFGEMKLSDITEKNIMDWQDTYLKPRNYSDISMKIINGRLSTLFNFAVRYYKLPRNPVPGAGPIGSLRRKNKYEIWTINEMRRFLIALSSNRSQWATIFFQVLFFTGMRPCEALALSADDIDFNKGTISVTKSYHYDATDTKKGYITPPKNDYSNREILVPPFLLKELAYYVDCCRKSGFAERIFPVNGTTAYLTMKRYAKKAGLKPIRLYDLRHSHASMLISAHQDINLIAARMGHCSPETTLRVYTHLYQKRPEEITNYLNQEGEKIPTDGNCGQMVVNPKIAKPRK